MGPAPGPVGDAVNRLVSRDAPEPEIGREIDHRTPARANGPPEETVCGSARNARSKSAERASPSCQRDVLETPLERRKRLGDGLVRVLLGVSTEIHAGVGQQHPDQLEPRVPGRPENRYLSSPVHPFHSGSPPPRRVPETKKGKAGPAFPFGKRPGGRAAPRFTAWRTGTACCTRRPYFLRSLMRASRVRSPARLRGVRNSGFSICRPSRCRT